MNNVAAKITKPPIHHQAFNSWAKAIKNSSSPNQALNLYSQMHRKSIPFNTFSILYTLKSITQLQKTSLLYHLHAHILKLGFSTHVYVATSLLHAYVVASFDDAKNLFDEMPEKNTITWNTIVKGYSNLGQIVKARKVFDEMPEKDLASWSTMIACYVNNGDLRSGLALFRGVFSMDTCLKPDQVMLGTILSACGQTGSIAAMLGKSIHGYILKNNWVLNVELGTALVDMYSKFGFLKKAAIVFTIMENRNVLSWTVLICGAAQNGFGKEALSIFEEMIKAGKVKPNKLTFTGVLSACAQAGLIDEGRKYFKMIEKCYNIEPTIQHYGCLVDMFGKKGLLGEALKVIEEMKLKPNVVIWGSFLSACKLHKQFEMAESVIDRVMEVVDPENNGGVYTLISDIYVLNNKWDEAERVRRLMEKQNVKKTRGSSFIR